MHLACLSLSFFFIFCCFKLHNTILTKEIVNNWFVNIVVEEWNRMSEQVVLRTQYRALREDLNTLWLGMIGVHRLSLYIIRRLSSVGLKAFCSCFKF